jgi:hypothetical protein
MKPINQTETIDEVKKWMMSKKVEIDKHLVQYMEEVHNKLNEVEEKGRQRILYLEDLKVRNLQ